MELPKPEPFTISLSEEWAELSAELCGPEFLKSLATFFENNGAHHVLECACGDGHVLNGLAGQGISGIGIDMDDYLIDRAAQIHNDPRIKFKKLNILDLDKDEELRNQKFDAVILRGNSITALGAWGTDKATFNPDRCQKAIEQALTTMWGKVKEGGILYLDVTRQEDIDKGGHEMKIDLGNVHLTGVITIDQAKKRRDAYGHGTVNGKPFDGGSSSYLISPDELRELVQKLLQPQKIWTPAEVKDNTYEIICVSK